MPGWARILVDECLVSNELGCGHCKGIMRPHATLTLAAALWLSPVQAVDPVVDLSYGKYKGKALGNGITQWLGVRFAAPPLRDLRFTPPHDPPRQHEVQDASEVGYPTVYSVRNKLTGMTVWPHLPRHRV